ncbi:MAG: hypothetical protein IJB20_10000 [Clostridia bacterium]|nr:hypothetical protein [Clostridia bacterium]
MADKTMQPMLLRTSKIRYHRACDYRTLTEILGELAVRHPSLEVSGLGTSVLDRPIPVVTIGHDPHSRSILYLGGIHPTDVMTPAVLLRFVSDYADALENGGRLYNVSLPYLYESRTIRVIPMLNPDGYEIRRYGAAEEVVRDRLLKQNGSGDFRTWRGNARGVDLWRNFTECPEKITDDEEICPQGTAGLSPGSEPEISALCNFLRIMDETAAVLSLHMDGNRLRYFTGDHYPARSRTLARLLARMTGCSPEPLPQVPADSGGSLTDWFIRECGRPAFEFGCLTDETIVPDNPEDYRTIYAAFREALFSAPLMI